MNASIKITQCLENVVLQSLIVRVMLKGDGETDEYLTNNTRMLDIKMKWEICELTDSIFFILDNHILYIQHDGLEYRHKSHTLGHML